MNDEYLTPFFKKANIVYNNTPNSTTINNEIQKGGDLKDFAKSTAKLVGSVASATPNLLNSASKKLSKKIYDKSSPNGLSNMITDAIVSALKKSDEYLKDSEKRRGKIQTDISKIKGMTMPNAINLYYGGGLLVFGNDFEIKKMVHMFYDDNTKPVYFSEEIGDSMDNNTVNKKISTPNPNPYTSANMIQEIKEVIG